MNFKQLGSNLKFIFTKYSQKRRVFLSQAIINYFGKIFVLKSKHFMGKTLCKEFENIAQIVL